MAEEKEKNGMGKDGRESRMDIRGEERRLAQVEGKKKGDAKEKQQKRYRMKYINKFPNLV